MKRTFVEFPGASRVLKAEGISDDALRDLQRNIMQGAGEIVKGTGGIKKIRCPVPGRGRSGGIRVLFADYPDAGKCILLVAFAKNVKENLSKSEQNELAKMKAVLDKQFKEVTS